MNEGTRCERNTASLVTLGVGLQGLTGFRVETPTQRTENSNEPGLILQTVWIYRRIKQIPPYYCPDSNRDCPPTRSLTSQSVIPNIPPYCSDLQPIQHGGNYTHHRLKYKASVFCPHNTFRMILTQKQL